MKAIHLTLEEEDAVFFWREGKVYCEGYDLESERMALALTGYGEGVGPLLVAINDCCKKEAEFISQVENFSSGYEQIISRTYEKWPKRKLIFEYFSYSPDSSIRWSGLKGARLSQRHYERMGADSDRSIKVQMARIKELPVKYFYQLLNLSRWDVNAELGENINCPRDVLEILAADENEWSRRGVATNSTCPSDILELLARDKNVFVRMCVAENPSCPSDILELLARDKNISVRMCVSSNPNCTEGILEVLAKDDEAKIRWSVVGNSACTERILELLAKDKNAKVRLLVPKNPACSERILKMLAHDKDRWVRTNVAENPSCPNDILEILSSDKSIYVRRAVQQNSAHNKGVEV